MRLQQLNPGNYKASAQISAEFENLVRYLNAAERGNRTVGELLAQIFDSSGSWAGPVEIAFDTGEGLRYRVGSYTDPSEGWITLAQPGDLRGPAGSSVGEITAPAITAPVVTVATASQTVFPASADPDDKFLVYRNGILQREGALYDYVVNYTTPDGFGPQQIVMNAPQTSGTLITYQRVRVTTSMAFYRRDHYTTGSQAVFSYPVELTDYPMQVYRNGIFQREGGSYDYTRQTASPTITFNSSISAGETISVWGLVPGETSSVPGIMLEADFVDAASGGIRLAKVDIENEAIPATKVAGLAALQSAAARMHIGASAPSDPTATRLWLDTAESPATLKVWDGSVWLRTSIENYLPSTGSTDAGLYLRVNALGTGYELDTVDLSSVIPRTWLGAANGVAQLGSDGRIQSSQMPSISPSSSIFLYKSGAISNADYVVKRIYGERLLITGVAARLASGTCSAQLKIGGTLVGQVHALSSTPIEVALTTPIEVDSSSALRTIQVTVSGGSAPTELELTLAVRNVVS